ncbi:hypothetical protein MTO96_000745 [Rhipicephalus appendiculatus]
MSSTTAASQPVANIGALLPAEVWTKVFRHMDIETLLNMCEAAPELKSIAFSPRVTQIVRTDPQTNFRTVEKFPTETRKALVLGNHVTVVSISVDVRQLHFTNCLALPSRVIIACAQSCNNLRELYCVNCLVEPDKLFNLLSGILQGLEKLEWSLFHFDYYESKLDDHVISSMRPYRKSKGPLLRSMYVEVVVTYPTVQLLESFEQATVCLEANSRAPSLFTQATASSEYWNDIKRLTLALSTPGGAVSPSHPPVAHGAYVNPIRQFLETCVSQITELNVTAFHFGVECDVCNLVASALPELRALALTPCGINLARSLQSLADGCTLLEHLDVRASPSRCTASPCNVCRLPLRFTRPNFELLQKKTLLRRLSIDETAPIGNLIFLVDCRVEKLRLSLDKVIDEDLAECPPELGVLLALNTRLSSLTLVARKASRAVGRRRRGVHPGIVNGGRLPAGTVVRLANALATPEECDAMYWRMSSALRFRPAVVEGVRKEAGAFPGGDAQHSDDHVQALAVGQHH